MSCDDSDCAGGCGAPASQVVVSVIIPAFNAAAYIAEAVASVPSESALLTEIIVIDDASTDQTLEIVEDVARLDPRIRTLRMDQSRGPSAARNLGFKNARGTWIALLDADDKWLEGRLEGLVYEAEARDLDFLADNQLLLDEASGQLEGLAFPHGWMTTAGDLTFRELIERDWPGRQRCRPLGNLKPVIRRVALQRLSVVYREDVKVAEDFLFYGEALLAGARFGLCGNVGYVYRMRSGSASAPCITTFQAVIDVNRRLLRACEEKVTDPRERSRFKSLLSLREQAVLYQQLAYLLKARKLALAFETFVSMKWTYAFFRLCRAVLIRASLMRDGSVGA